MTDYLSNLKKIIKQEKVSLVVRYHGMQPHINSFSFRLNISLTCHLCFKQYAVDVNEQTCDIDFKKKCTCGAHIEYEFENLPEENDIIAYSSTLNKYGDLVKPCMIYRINCLNDAKNVFRVYRKQLVSITWFSSNSPTTRPAFKRFR